MRHVPALCLITAALVATAGTVLAADAPAARPQSKCPVTGEPIDRAVHLDVQCQRIYFCCPKCPAEFRNDPEKYFARVAQDGVVLENIQTTCPVSGEKLGEGDMGKPASVSYKGRTVGFCCNMCVKKFEADPAKYLAKPPGEPTPARR